MHEYKYVTLRERPQLKDSASEWFHLRWGVPKEAYLACMDAYLHKETEYGWYLCLDKEKIIGGLGVIENDFHDRKDLTPNICAVYTDKEYRCMGIAGRLLNIAVEDLKSKGITPIYFINGTAYAGKSTMVKMLAEKYDAIACEENYHNSVIENLNKDEFPNLTYTRDLENWSDFIRRTPEEYEAWINGCTKECTILELNILKELSKQNKMIFVDTNIDIDTLKEIADKDHVLIMLAEPDVSVNRFFERPDKEKQFLYQLLLKEDDPDKAIENFRECLKRINSKENYERFFNSGFHVMLRDEKRTVEDSCLMAEKLLKLK